MALLKKKKNLSALTVLEREREIKKLRGETEELIDAMGQESEEKAAPIVKEYVDEINEEQALQQGMDVEQLKHLSNNKLHYQRYLIRVLNRFLVDESIPKSYKLYVESNDEGIVLGIEGTSLVSAFKAIGVPKYDIAACKTLAIRMGNTIAHMEGYRREKGGVFLPDEIDLKKYGKRRPN